MNKNNNHDQNFLWEELSELEQKRAELLLKLKMARLNGDYMENGDQQILEEENYRLQEQINSLKIKKATTKEIISKFITYRLLETGEEITIELSNAREPDHSEGRISFICSLGLALANKKVGEISEVKTKQGSYKIKVLNIKEK